MEKNGRILHYIQPKYYKNFSCIGGNCPMTCCYGWRIDWTKEEVEKLKAAECSDCLKELIDNSFKEYGENYVIKLNEKEYCPFHDENKLCSIQKNLGVDYMSHTCMHYPRNNFSVEGYELDCCNFSCIHIVDILLNDRSCMELERYTRTLPEKKVLRRNEELLAKYPEIRYYRQLFEFYYDIISNESHSLETSILWGSYVSIKLTELVKSGRYSQTLEEINRLRKDINRKDMSDKLEAINPNYDIKLKFVINLMKIPMGINAFNDIILDENTVDIEKFQEGERRFKAAFADRPFAMRNIALELLMDLGIPFYERELSIFDNYCYFIAAFTLIKLMGPAFFVKDISDPESEYKKCISTIGRGFKHNKEVIKLVVVLLKHFRCEVPANLAAIIK